MKVRKEKTKGPENGGARIEWLPAEQQKQKKWREGVDRGPAIRL